MTANRERHCVVLLIFLAHISSAFGDDSGIHNGPISAKTSNLSDDQTSVSNWMISQPFGYYFETQTGWIYSQKLGWLYDSKVPSIHSNRWFFNSGLNWLWGGDSIGPFLYSKDMARWFYVEEGKIFDFNRGLWKSKNGTMWLGFVGTSQYFSGKFSEDFEHFASGSDIVFERSLRNEKETKQIFHCRSFSLEIDVTLLGGLTIK